MQHILQGVVVEHTSHTTRRWLRRVRFPSVRVQFSPEEYARLALILDTQACDCEGGHVRPHPVPEVTIGFWSETERDRFQVREPVGVVLTIFEPWQQMFLIRPVYRWEGVKKLPNKG